MMWQKDRFIEVSVRSKYCCGDTTIKKYIVAMEKMTSWILKYITRAFNKI